jgi:hypothetical protein
VGGEGAEVQDVMIARGASEMEKEPNVQTEGGATKRGNVRRERNDATAVRMGKRAGVSGGDCTGNSAGFTFVEEPAEKGESSGVCSQEAQALDSTEAGSGYD